MRLEMDKTGIEGAFRCCALGTRKRLVLRGGDTCVSVYRVVSLYRCIALYRAVSLYRDIEALSPREGKYTAV